MATLQIPVTSYGYVNGGSIAGYGTNRLTSTSHSNTALTTGISFTFGSVWRGFLSFDISGIPDNAENVVTKLVMRVLSGFSSGHTFDVCVRPSTWTAPLSAGNREAPYDESRLGTTEVVFANSTALGTSHAGEWVTSPALSPAAIVNGATVKYSLISSQDIAGTAPFDINQNGSFYVTAGNLPYLLISYDLPNTDLPGGDGHANYKTDPGATIDHAAGVLGHQCERCDARYPRENDFRYQDGLRVCIRRCLDEEV